MNNFPTRFYLMTAASLVLAGCNSSSPAGDGDGGGGSADVSAVCEANVSLASNGNGVGYEGLRYYRAGNALCAFDTNSGTAFSVDTNSESNMELVVTDYVRSGENLTSPGVAYVADGHIWYADTASSAGSVSPRQVSSEAKSQDIVQMALAPDHQDGGKGSLVYNKVGEGWLAAEIDQNSSVDPIAFGDSRIPIGPYYDGDQLTHWIVHDTNSARLILVEVSDVATETAQLETDVFSVNYVGFFANSNALLGIGDKFMFLEENGTGPELVEATGDGFDAAGGLAGLGFVASAALTVENTIFLGLQNDDKALLLEADAISNEVTVIDEDSTAGDSFPVLVTAQDDHVAWAWTHSAAQDEGESGLVVIDRTGDTPSKNTVTGGEDIIIGTSVIGRADGWVYYSTTDLSDEQNPEYSAHFFDVTDPNSVTTLDDASWTGSTANVGSSGNLNYSADAVVDAVLLIQKQSGESDDKVLAYDATTPTSGSTELGTIPGVSGLAASIAPVQKLLGSSLGLGPGRLFVHGQGTNQTLLYMDTGHSGSLVELGEMDSLDAVVSVQSGF